MEFRINHFVHCPTLLRSMFHISLTFTVPGREQRVIGELVRSINIYYIPAMGSHRKNLEQSCEIIRHAFEEAILAAA